MSEVITEKTRGEKLESVAFSFCKAATVALVFQKFALPAAALLSATFFLLALYYGKRDSKCVLRYPLLIATFWLVVAVVWALFYFS